MVGRHSLIWKWVLRKSGKQCKTLKSLYFEIGKKWILRLYCQKWIFRLHCHRLFWVEILCGPYSPKEIFQRLFWPSGVRPQLFCQVTIQKVYLALKSITVRMTSLKKFILSIWNIFCLLVWTWLFYFITTSPL